MTQTDTQDHLNRLLAYLDSDPDNPNLLRDAAEAAFNAQDPARAGELLARLEAVTELDAGAQNLAGLIALLSEDFKTAAARFTPLLETHPHETGLRFNLAWSLALSGDHDQALETLDQATTTALPQAAMLDVQLRHDRGEFRDAAERARIYARQHPGDPGLSAAISVLALDVEDKDLARETALRGGDHPDALTTLGTLSLGEQKIEEAQSLFRRALDRNPDSPRALIGRGLIHLMQDATTPAARDLDRGADLFETHLGSWLAAGWAYLIAGDLETAQARFQHAMDLDDTFAENHGALAVIAALQGDIETSEQRCKTALRLDRDCFSAAFAQVLLKTGRGDTDGAKAIFERAITTPVGPDGETVAMALARMNVGV